MRDLQFIVLSDTFDVLSKTELEGQSKRTIQVKSSGNLNYTKKVVVNDLSISDFTLVDSETINVRLPDQLAAVTVGEMEIRIFSSQLTDPGTATVEFDLTNRFTSVSGTQKLAQQVMKTLITTAQTNRFYPTEGGSLLNVLGGTVGASEVSQVAAAVAQAVSDTKSFFETTQSNQKLPLDERILDLTVYSVEFDSTTLEVKAKVRLTTLSGKTEILPIVL